MTDSHTYYRYVFPSQVRKTRKRIWLYVQTHEYVIYSVDNITGKKSISLVGPVVRDCGLCLLHDYLDKAHNGILDINVTTVSSHQLLLWNLHCSAQCEMGQGVRFSSANTTRNDCESTGQQLTWKFAFWNTARATGASFWKNLKSAGDLKDRRANRGPKGDYWS